MRRISFKGSVSLQRHPPCPALVLTEPVSYRDVRDLLVGRGFEVDAATVFRWVQNFEQEITRRLPAPQLVGLRWHVDETYLRVNGR